MEAARGPGDARRAIAPRVVADQVVADLVVAEADIRYLAPLREDIACRCTAPEGAVRAFVETLESRGRARLALEVAIGDGPAAVLRAEMYARRA